ncbi:hypothetical protein AB205_0181910 [Aquarana catesbeiana]|uniref:C2H2-type domain-containing protein n=1 Tax=Aquarana catesbeiana TaxID=8400 RepID=A0A2G9Q9M3_AQUCT|nr:hypothetical protein AB205_0181910 [Aquarana catesbeiana]
MVLQRFYTDILEEKLFLRTQFFLCCVLPLLGLQYHKRTEHFDEKPFSCEECGAKFAANSTLKNHQRLHTGERPFVCKHCHMTFTQAAALSYHTKKKHSEAYPVYKAALDSFSTETFILWFAAVLFSKKQNHHKPDAICHFEGVM